MHAPINLRAWAALDLPCTHDPLNSVDVNVCGKMAGDVVEQGAVFLVRIWRPTPLSHGSVEVLLRALVDCCDAGINLEGIRIEARMPKLVCEQMPVTIAR